MSSYKDQTTRETKIFQQKGEHRRYTNKQTKIKQKKQRTPMWNHHTYDSGTWTKDKIEMEQLLGKMSWSSIVNRTSKQNSYPYTINLSQDSPLYHNNYRQRRKKKDKANEYIEIMGKRSTNKASKTQIYHNNPKLTIPEKNN